MPRIALSHSPVLTRRSVLLGAGAAALAGCTGQASGPASPSPAAPAPDERLRRAVAVAEAELVALYAAARAAHPDLADALAQVEARHRKHSAAIGASGRMAPVPRRMVAEPASTAGSATATPTPTPTPSPTVPAIPGDPAQARRTLLRAEEQAAVARLQDCLNCEDAALAELLAAIAAGEAANAVLLAAAQ
jgi:hypothetical protein